MAEKFVRTADYQLRWAMDFEPAEANAEDLGLKGAQFSTWDDLPRQQKNDRRIEQWRQKVRKAKERGKKAPKKPKLIPRLVEGEEPDYEAIVDIIDCRRLEEDLYELSLHIVFKDEHEIRFSFEVPRIPIAELSRHNSIQIPNVDLGRGSEKFLRNRQLLVSNMCSHVCRSALDKMEELRSA